LTALAEEVWAGLLIDLLSGAALLVGVVVRFAVHARRGEIEILQLLGASPARIRPPFLLERVSAGGLGGLWATFAFPPLAGWERRVGATLPLPEELSLGVLAGAGGFVALVLAGMFLGATATSFALARELR